MSIILLLLALLWLAFTGVEASGGSEQSCSIDSPNGIERCGPETSNGLYRLPAGGVVVRAAVNNGPVSPESQAGYVIEIDVTGALTITEQGEGAAPVVRTETVTVAELQDVLAQLDDCGFYYLPQRSEFENSALRVGGSVSVIEIHLRNGDWESVADTLSESERFQLESCQTDLAERFDLEPPD